MSEITNFSVLNDTIWKIRKNTIANTVGNPIPPFRMMAPRGAPMKKKMMHAKASIGLRCHSTWKRVICSRAAERSVTVRSRYCKVLRAIAMA